MRDVVDSVVESKLYDAQDWELLQQVKTKYAGKKVLDLPKRKIKLEQSVSGMQGLTPFSRLEKDYAGLAVKVDEDCTIEVEQHGTMDVDRTIFILIKVFAYESISSSSNCATAMGAIFIQLLKQVMQQKQKFKFEKMTDWNHLTTAFFDWGIAFMKEKLGKDNVSAENEIVEE